MGTTTNRLGLPEPIVRAFDASRYDSGRSEFTATELNQPSFQRALRKKHQEDIVVDVSDQLYSLLGKATHQVLEYAKHYKLKDLRTRLQDRLELIGAPLLPSATEKCISVKAALDELEATLEDKHEVWDGFLFEERLYGKIQVGDKEYLIGGAIDLLDKNTGTISDYKTCSVWKVMLDSEDGLQEWENQLNVYRWLAKQNGIEINRLQIVALFRDWSKTKAARGERGYPLNPVQLIPINLWDFEKTESYIRERVLSHLEAEAKLETGNAKHCSEEERWERGKTWAVMKAGRKSALRVLDAEHKARAWQAGQGDSDTYIEYRPGFSTRCVHYCDVKDFCPFGKGLSS